MARDREIVCSYYIAAGQCKKGREAAHKGCCQKCDKYEPRARVKLRNRKKEALNRLRGREKEWV